MTNEGEEMQKYTRIPLSTSNMPSNLDDDCPINIGQKKRKTFKCEDCKESIESHYWRVYEKSHNMKFICDCCKSQDETK